ncbi:MAG: FAD-binding protein [Acidobacteria bacterium]|nr:MAG: FAD-binding protein [Acidobacteriota bacterium]
MVVEQRPASAEQLCELVREGSDASLRFVGVGTKPLLAPPAGNAVTVVMGTLRGITEYRPSEFTLSALAGTPLTEISDALAENGQFLPFDPPLVRAGATLGGAIASGLAGPGRMHWGGVRDYVLEVRCVDGLGRLVRGGGRVVKNAAGFDLPKLMVGAGGRLGPLVEVTLKIFPRPLARHTVAVDLAGPAPRSALELVGACREDAIACEALEIELLGADRCRGWLRLAGAEHAVAERTRRAVGGLRARYGAAAAEACGEDVEGDGSRGAPWRRLEDWSWVPPGAVAVRAPSSLRATEALVERCWRPGEPGWIGAGGQQLLLALSPQRLSELWSGGDELTARLQPVRGADPWPAGAPRPDGVAPAARAFYEAARSALDPNGRFAR